MDVWLCGCITLVYYLANDNYFVLIKGHFLYIFTGAHETLIMAQEWVILVQCAADDAAK